MSIHYFHLAAFKHVGIAETQARECTKSNVIGSMNVLEEAVNNKVEFVLGISTDKAAQIAGVYGATKYIMEKIFQQFERNYPKTKLINRITSRNFGKRNIKIDIVS